MLKKRYGYIMRRSFLSFILLLPFLSIVFGQSTKIIIKAPESVLVGEQFRVDYVIEGDNVVKEPIIIKNMENFSILYGPAVSSSTAISFKNGKRVAVYTSTSTYYLEAQKGGKYTLPKVELVIAGKKYKSDAFKIEVKSINDEVENIDAFVKTIVSKSSVNLSDTLMLTYRLYTTKEIRRVINSDFPSIYDFYSTHVARSRQLFSEETINGKKYKVVDLRSLILQPRNTGQITIPEGQISLEYSTPTGRKVRDMWGDVYDEAIKTEKTLKIESVIIRVQDLKEI